MYAQQRKLEQAEPLYLEALRRHRRLFGDDHMDTLLLMNNVGSVLKMRGKLAEAETLLREALARERRILGDDHRNTLITISNLALLLEERGRRAEAEPLFAEIYRRAPGSQLDPASVAEFMCGYGVCLVGMGRYADAEEPLRVAMDRVRKGPDPGGYPMRKLARAMIDLCDHTNRPDEAAKWRTELSALQAATQPASQPATNPTPQPQPQPTTSP